MNPNMPPFMPYPMMGMGPPMMTTPDYHPGDPPPTRVRIAMEMLRDLTHKTMNRVAVNDVSIEEIKGQGLTTAESNLQASAANILNEYFKGKMKMNQWERSEYRGNNPQSSSLMMQGMIMNCILCNMGKEEGHIPNPECSMCRGCGEVVVFPRNR